VLRANTNTFRQPDLFEPPSPDGDNQFPAPPPNPTVSDSYSHAWNQLKQFFLHLFIIGLAWGLIQSLMLILSAIVKNRVSEEASLIFDVSTNFLIGIPLEVGLAFAYLQAARGLRPDVGDLFIGFRRVYLSSILSSLLYLVLIFAGLILFIIPGFIVAVRLSLYPYLLADEQLGPGEALRESWRRTAGYGWTAFGISFLGIPIILVGLLFFIVGIIPAIMLVQLATASFYYALSARQGYLR
jgi:uncharacterized membrane protein